MQFKFKRYKVNHDKKDYYIFIPEYIDSYFNYICDGDGYSYIYGDRKAIKQLVACFSLLSWNPYAVVYLPTKHNKVPSSVVEWEGYPKLDMVIRTNKTVFKCSKWKEIRKRIYKVKPTIYKFDLNIERMKNCFDEDIQAFQKKRYEKISKKAGADLRVANDTFFLSFPRIKYICESIDLYDYFFNCFKDPKTQYGYSSGDTWTNQVWTCFAWGEVERLKFTENRPPVTLSIDCYDIDIVNRYTTKKERLIQR